jgi:hypothetical protein
MFMNAWGHQGLAWGTAAALALTGGAWGAAQTPQTAPQTTPSQTAPQTTTQSAPAPQTAPASQQQTAPSSQTTSAAGATQPAQRTLELVRAQAELNKTIDAKKAKQGDPVMAKLVADVQVPGAQPLPKNTVLEGHVDQVTASEHKSDSTMVVTFDKAKLKDGQEVPIKATILAMAEPAMAAADTGGGGGGGGAMPAGGGGAMPAGGGGGGAAGGGGVRGGSGGGGGGASSPAPQQAPSVGDSGGGGGQQQPQTQSVPDVKLTSDIHQHNSATFTSKGKNVHVPDGTQMELAIAVVPAGVKLQ